MLRQVTELWQFFLVRMLTGISVGGCFPLVFSLLGDLFPVSQRAAMAAIVQIAVGGGIGGGQVSKYCTFWLWCDTGQLATSDFHWLGQLTLPH